jgi:drug/metabolite transporter (DMT)-like permease
MAVAYELMAVGAAACWALGSLTSAPASSHLGAVAFSRWRMLFATALLGTLAWWQGGWTTLLAMDPGGGVGSGWGGWLPGAGLLMASGLIGIFLGDSALFGCMNRLGPRRSGVLFACHALFSALLAWLWLGETFVGQALVGGGLLVAGVMMAIVWGKRRDEVHVWEQVKGPLWVGVALGLLAALCQAVATLMVKPLMGTGTVDPVAASAVRMATALGAHSLLWLSGWRTARCAQPMNWPMLGRTAFNAALAMGLGMTLILTALQGGKAGLVAVLSSVTPVLVLPLLWLVYRRQPAPGAWAGAALTVVGGAVILVR